MKSLGGGVTEAYAGQFKIKSKLSRLAYLRFLSSSNKRGFGYSPESAYRLYIYAISKKLKIEMLEEQLRDLEYRYSGSIIIKEITALFEIVSRKTKYIYRYFELQAVKRFG